MITRFSFFVTVGLFAISCGSKKRDTQTDNISGVYVREYSFKVIHPERGDTIGVRTIRDTIFIGQRNQYYEVSNRKWKLNEYDKEGWKSMEHDDDRPTPIYKATFNNTDKTLVSEEGESILLGLSGQLYRGMKRDKPYKKIKIDD